MKIRINFSEVPEIKPVPAGLYPATVTDVELRESSSSEHPYLNWTWTLQGTAEFSEAEGRKVWMVTSLSPKALWKLRQVLRALQYPADLDEDIELDLNWLLGKKALLAVSVEDFGGTLRNRVDSVHPIPEEDDFF